MYFTLLWILLFTGACAVNCHDEISTHIVSCVADNTCSKEKNLYDNSNHCWRDCICSSEECTCQCPACIQNCQCTDVKCDSTGDCKQTFRDDTNIVVTTIVVAGLVGLFCIRFCYVSYQDLYTIKYECDVVKHATMWLKINGANDEEITQIQSELIDLVCALPHLQRKQVELGERFRTRDNDILEAKLSLPTKHVVSVLQHANDPAFLHSVRDKIHSMESVSEDTNVNLQIFVIDQCAKLTCCGTVKGSNEDLCHTIRKVFGFEYLIEVDQRECPGKDITLFDLYTVTDKDMFLKLFQFNANTVSEKLATKGVKDFQASSQYSVSLNFTPYQNDDNLFKYTSSKEEVFIAAIRSALETCVDPIDISMNIMSEHSGVMNMCFLVRVIDSEFPLLRSELNCTAFLDNVNDTLNKHQTGKLGVYDAELVLHLALLTKQDIGNIVEEIGETVTEYIDSHIILPSEIGFTFKKAVKINPQEEPSQVMQLINRKYQGSQQESIYMMLRVSSKVHNEKAILCGLPVFRNILEDAVQRLDPRLQNILFIHILRPGSWESVRSRLMKKDIDAKHHFIDNEYISHRRSSFQILPASSIYTDSDIELDNVVENQSSPEAVITINEICI